MKKGFCVFVLLAGLCALAQAQASSRGANVTGIDVPYALECVRELDGTITITDYIGTLPDVVIPEKINGLPVASIARDAFRNMGITSVVIPSSVTSIRPRAFFNNRYLTSVTIGANVELFDDSFYSEYGGDMIDWVYNNKGGKQAGTYTRPNADSSEWTKQP